MEYGPGGGSGWCTPTLSASPPPPPPMPPCRCRANINGCYPQPVYKEPSILDVNHYGSGPGLYGAFHDEDESSIGALRERELHALHRAVPALRRTDVDTRAIRHHFYPEGGWGWIICGAAFYAHVLSTGLQLSYGALHVYALRHLQDNTADSAMWAGAVCLGMSRLSAVFVAGACGGGRRSPRLAAAAGGLLMPLACLFTSFAMQLHQMLVSYGIVLGAGCGLVRETAGLMLGNYFRKRRQFVELVAQSGGGVGIALFSVFYKEAVGKLGWRLGLQAVTGFLISGFFLSTVYRSASLYHPQRRAILHLKNQKRKVKEKKTHVRVKKPPVIDLSPLRSRTVQLLVLSSGIAALGLYTPVFYLAPQGYREGLEDSAIVLLQTFLGFAVALGCAGGGAAIARPSRQCRVSPQYLCQTAMIGVGISLLALSSIQGYHGYMLFVWLYGLCLGSFLYSIKTLTMERVRARHFAKVWGYIQGAEAIPVILGVPFTGYINQHSLKAGYYFSFASTVVGAILLFFVGFSKQPEPGNSVNSAMTATTITNGDCVCPGMSPRFTQKPPHCSSLRHCYFPAHNVFGAYNYHHPHVHQFHNGLPKSLSFATPLDYYYEPINYAYNYPCKEAPCCRRSPYHKKPEYKNLRPSKSVPEGLSRSEQLWSRGGSCRSLCRRPIIRNVQVIEQITTSV